ncbi:hypothetical protein FPOAC2_00104 [Fusarium poae]|jgi:hypothetical protein|uniref:hypothetical protein n=1 Tax=Fusarium poae TaxID=36050 RepID=UPI001CE72A04|nr:hypothetical protein FPOAC1_000091 [Fusarium poae]KAG8674128.1 hypothetical protein FPOAC1_000091 [Fusarium poae]
MTILLQYIPNLAVENFPKAFQETEITRMEGPAGPSLNAKDSFKASKRHAKYGNHGITPINNACDVTCDIVYMDVVLEEVVMLESHGIVWPKEKWKLPPNLIQLGL